MPAHEQSPDQPDEQENQPDDLRRDADGDVVGLDGQKLPRVLADIPCDQCNQHTRCIAAERCLGPPAREPGRGRLSSRGPGDSLGPTNQQPHLWERDIRPETSRKEHPVGEPFIEGGGGIAALRPRVEAALGDIASAGISAQVAFGVIHTAANRLRAHFEGTTSPHAEAALNALTTAHETHARSALEALNMASTEMTAFYDSLESTR